ncbi:MAG: EFR1 family ferrodoxin [Ruminococcus sp.]|uniref:EFR1 family ferrodoxin n=1 Tax=Ruminococcus sp. TaxID=41978 RepID=UPI0025F28611|nr:EFR1 family ferrodoxin [Ruminococcus sp.]MCR4795012.1 EFR1 family ferrodoxin [Ruminococcus sp.]
MILYFSATGNTEFLATELAKKTGDQCLNLLERIKNKDYSEIYSEKPFVICAPVYVCEMPRFFSDYIKKVPLKGCRDIYFIVNSAGYGGISGYLAKKAARHKKLRFMGYNEIVMPRNYFISHYPVQTKDEIRERLVNACEKVNEIADKIKKGEKLQSRYIFLFEKIITIPFNPVWSKYKMTAKAFYAADSCIGCGKCARVCPLNNIIIKDKKPVWGDKCTHCMACIGNCPKDAIFYGNVTSEKGKYNFRDYKYMLGDNQSAPVKNKEYQRRKNG